MQVDLPVRERLLLDERMLPTGERETTSVAPGALGDRTFDDASWRLLPANGSR